MKMGRGGGGGAFSLDVWRNGNAIDGRELGIF